MEGATGFCHLCGVEGSLRESHVWPRFAYKNYVSDVDRGGQFTDLQSMTRHGRQMKETWLCDGCEQHFNRFETPTAAFLRNITEASPGQFHYASFFLPFTVSLSWRIAKYYLPRAKRPEDADLLRPALKRWKDYLRGRTRSVSQFTQHAFIAFGENIEGKDAEFHRCLGGQIFQQERSLFWRLGPLMVFALLSRSQLSKAEINTLSKSEVRPDRGLIERVYKNRPEPSLTRDMTRMLNRQESWVIGRGAEMCDSD